MSSNFIKLGQVATFINGKAFKPNEWVQSGIPIIRIQNLTNNTKEFNYYQGKLEPRYVVKKGDILISWSASLGVFEWDGPDAALNQHIFKVQFNKLDVDKTYFKFIVSQVINEMLRFVHGSTMKHIVKNDFDNTKIPLPKLSDQHRIATILDHADSIRRRNRQILEKYNELAQSVYQDMFGDTFLNDKKWGMAFLTDLVKKDKIITYGIVQAGPNYETGIPYIRTGDIVNGKIKEEQLLKTSPEIAKSYTRSRCETGDIIISIRATVGTIAILPETLNGANLTQGTARISPDVKKINPVYLYYTIKSKGIQTKINIETKGATFREITLKRLREISIPNPRLHEQDKFEEAINIINQQKDLTQKSLQKSEDLFQSLLHKAFKGEL